MFGGVCGGERGNTVGKTLFADFFWTLLRHICYDPKFRSSATQKVHQIAYLRCLIGFYFFLDFRYLP